MGRNRPEVGQQGFTLLELVVTLLILAIATGLAAPAIGRTAETIRARAEVARFSALLRHAREQAITTRRPHSLVIDPTDHWVAIMAGDEVQQRRQLSADLLIEADPPPALTVRFEPHGVSSGGSFRVTTGAVRHRVRVDGLTGRVKAQRE
jgi:type II secretion system protein H